MGGSGSGTWYRWESKHKLEQMLRFDIRNMKKTGMLATGVYKISWASGQNEDSIASAQIGVLSGKGMAVRFMWKNDTSGLWQEMTKVVQFTQTDCTYGGYRQWFLCPVCNKRIAVLAFNPPAIACRHCFNLTYSSQNEHTMYRALRRRNKIGDRIGVSNLFDFYGVSKPKGMHWKTFYRLRSEYEHFDEFSVLNFNRFNY